MNKIWIYFGFKTCNLLFIMLENQINKFSTTHYTFQILCLDEDEGPTWNCSVVKDKDFLTTPCR